MVKFEFPATPPLVLIELVPKISVLLGSAASFDDPSFSERP